MHPYARTTDSLTPASLPERLNGGPHFRDTHWIDLVRGVVTPDDAAVMRQHLDAGCGQCAETYAFWRKLARFIEFERANQAGFRFSRTARTARLVFDTLAQPAVAGTGSTAADGRRLVYEAPPFAIELLLDSHTDPVGLRITGQILEKRRFAARPQGARVSIRNSEGELCATDIDGLGRFQCRIAPRQNVNLTIVLREGELIVIPLSAVPLIAGVSRRRPRAES
jgi:hypothetical protein